MKIPFVVVLKVVERERLSSNVCQKVKKEMVGLQNYKLVTEKGGSLDTVINKVLVQLGLNAPINVVKLCGTKPIIG